MNVWRKKTSWNKKIKNRQFIILSSIIMYKIELELFHVSDEYWYTSNQASQDVPDQYKPKKYEYIVIFIKPIYQGGFISFFNLTQPVPSG